MRWPTPFRARKKANRVNSAFLANLRDQSRTAFTAIIG
jgi:hypothetical protein